MPQNLDGVRVRAYLVSDSGFGASTFMVKGVSDHSNLVTDRCARVRSICRSHALTLFHQCIQQSRERLAKERGVPLGR